ncbi:hypothetical protein FACS1894211_12720 [Clostridia bacterium]|nr:hypothetical protein FACS1894211_12720 [Clostridia bacterium]
MFKITGKTIQITRGDTAVVEISMNGYSLLPNDTLTFTVKRGTEELDYLIRKVITHYNASQHEGRAAFKLESEDTAELRYDDYVYDVELKINGGEHVFTIIEPSTFRVMEEVSF